MILFNINDNDIFNMKVLFIKIYLFFKKLLIFNARFYFIFYFIIIKLYFLLTVGLIYERYQNNG
jgi:hypothetical protein